MISVALCTYNGEKYILEQLQSIARQNLLPGEIIVCDDGSRDNTLAVIKQFSKQIPVPVHIYNNATRLGAKLNFHKAIGLCNGEFIALCDQDDSWLPDNLEKKIAFLQAKKNGHIQVVFSDLQLVNDKLEKLSYTMWQSIEFSNSQQRAWRAGRALDVLIRRDNVVTGASIVFRASFRDKFMKYLTLEFDHWIHDAVIAIVAAKENAIQFIENSTILYRQHSAQLLGAGAVLQKHSFKNRLSGIVKGKLNLDPDLEKEIHFRERQSADFQKMGVGPDRTRYLEKYIQHIRRRREILRRSKLSRVFLIGKEFILMRYKKYSLTGLLDPARDLFHKKTPGSLIPGSA